MGFVVVQCFSSALAIWWVFGGGVDAMYGAVLTAIWANNIRPS